MKEKIAKLHKEKEELESHRQKLVLGDEPRSKDEKKHSSKITFLSGDIKKIDYQIHMLYEKDLKHQTYYTPDLDQLVVKLYRQICELRDLIE